MTAHPVDLVGGLSTTADVSKPEFVAFEKLRHRVRVANADEVRNTDFSGQYGGLYVASLNANFDLDADSTALDDDERVLIDSEGNHFLIVLNVEVDQEIQLSSRSAIATTTISTAVKSIRVAGYATAGDHGEGATYIRGTSAGPNAIADATGSYWQLPSGIPYRVEWFGALGGASDASAKITAAAEAAKSSTNLSFGLVEFGVKEGVLTIASGITLPNGQSWTGAPVSRVEIDYQPVDGVALKIKGDAATLSKFLLKNTGTATTSVGIEMNDGLTSGQQTVIEDTRIIDFATGIDIKSGAAWTIRNADISTFGTYGIRINNLVNPDTGDGFISGTTVNGTGDACIYYQTGGGLKIVGLKSLYADIGLHLDIPDGAVTQDLQIAASSFENSTVALMKFGRSGTTGLFGNVSIASCEFAGSPLGIWFANAGVVNAVALGLNFSSITDAAFRLDNGANNIVIGLNSYSCNTILLDNRTDFFEFGLIDLRDRVALNNSSATVYSTLWTVAVPAYRAVYVTVAFEGIKQSVGGFARREVFRLINDGGGGALLVKNLTSDESVFGFDFSIDVATAVGKAYVQYRTGTGAHLMQGTATIDCCEGKVSVFGRGAL